MIAVVDEAYRPVGLVDHFTLYSLHMASDHGRAPLSRRADLLRCWWTRIRWWSSTPERRLLSAHFTALALSGRTADLMRGFAVTAEGALFRGRHGALALLEAANKDIPTRGGQAPLNARQPGRGQGGGRA